MSTGSRRLSAASGGADQPPPRTRPARRPAFTRDSAVLRLPGSVSLEDLSSDWAWGGATGRGVRVAIIDSGIEADHPALGDCVDAEGGWP